MKNKTSNLFRTRHFFYALLVAVIFCACDRGEKHLPVVTAKYTQTFWGNDMQPCMCRFWYVEYDKWTEPQEFIDSCSKYNIGDTIVGRKK